jgi:hypothetical protein
MHPVRPESIRVEPVHPDRRPHLQQDPRDQPRDSRRQRHRPRFTGPRAARAGADWRRRASPTGSHSCRHADPMPFWPVHRYVLAPVPPVLQLLSGPIPVAALRPGERYHLCQLLHLRLQGYRVAPMRRRPRHHLRLQRPSDSQRNGFNPAQRDRTRQPVIFGAARAPRAHG